MKANQHSSYFDPWLTVHKLIQTVLTSMEFIDVFIKSHVQVYTHMLASMHLYKLILKIKWPNLERWKNLYGKAWWNAHMISFIGCIGTLMKGSGLKEI